MRVIPNGQGSEVVFSLARQADDSDAKFEEDKRWIKKDLKRLRDLLE